MTILVVTLALLAALTRGATPASSQPAPVLQELVVKRGKVNRIRERKCLGPAVRRYRLAVLVPVLERPIALRRENVRLRRALAAGHHCLPTTPSGIIRYVFPDSTEDAALRVAYCESRLYTYARNPSGASGLFQLMPHHWAGRFNPFNPWSNTRYALRLSDGGTNWGAWVCRP